MIIKPVPAGDGSSRSSTNGIDLDAFIGAAIRGRSNTAIGNKTLLQYQSLLNFYDVLCWNTRCTYLMCVCFALMLLSTSQTFVFAFFFSSSLILTSLIIQNNNNDVHYGISGILIHCDPTCCVRCDYYRTTRENINGCWFVPMKIV